MALVAILRQHGTALEHLGLVYLLGIVGAAKFLWAPYIDRHCPWPRLGHYRAWLIVSQSGMMLALLALSQLNVVHQFAQIFTICLIVAVCAATQGIAGDGLACRMLTTDARSTANALKTAGGLFGFMLGGGLVLMAYPWLGWQGSCILLAGGTALTLLQLPTLREPAQPASPLTTCALLARCWSFWHHSGGIAWLLTLLLFPMGTMLAYALITPVLVDAGWSMERIGLVVNLLGSILGMSSALLTGWSMRKIGRQRALLIAAILQLIAVLSIAIPVMGHHSVTAVAVATGIYFFCYNPALTVLGTLMMDRASVHSPATDYTLQYSVMTSFGMVLGSIGMVLAQYLGYAATLALATFTTLLAIAWVAIHQPTFAVPAKDAP